MMKPALLQKTALQQTLTPQQIQYLKLLQLPIIQLEQTIRQEIENNPFLEETRDDDVGELFAEHDVFAPAPDQMERKFEPDVLEPENAAEQLSDFYSNENYSDITFADELKTNKIEDGDSYDFYSYQWEDDADFSPKTSDNSDNDFEPFQIKDETTIYDDMLNQLNLIDLTDEEKLICSHIIGNIDEDGYLRRDLQSIVDETNSFIAEHNFDIQKQQYELQHNTKKNNNPAKNLALAPQSVCILKEAIDLAPEILKEESYSRRLLEKYNSIDESSKIFSPVNIKTAEAMLKIVQKLEPPGIAARNIQECLIAQLDAKQALNSAQKLARQILINHFEEFSKKHFIQLQKLLNVSNEQIREAFEEIKRLNPKPGGSDFKSETNTIIPDFIAYYDEDIDDIIINVNDSTIPTIKVSSTYEKIRQQAKNNKLFNKETKTWIRDKFENAKFFIQAVRQRNITMLMVMTAIAHRQRDFFINNMKFIKPMIYKDIADDTSLDISTVCRIVNSKYVLTKLGTYELKYFFSEALPSDDGEEISTTVIKDKIKDIIVNEPKNKPFSDDHIVRLLKDEGYNVARRTIAKYRETLKIPVARLRKEL